MSATPKITLRKTRDFGQKINATIAFIRQNFKDLGMALMFIAGPIVIFQSLIQTIYMNDVASIFMQAVNGSYDFSSDNSFLLNLISSFLSFFIFAFVTSIIVEYFKIYMGHKEVQKISVKEVWQGVNSSVVKIFIAGLMLFVMGILFVLAIALFSFIIAAINSQVVYILFMAALFVVYFYIAVTLTLYFIVILFEDTKTSNYYDALVRCFFLIKGKWWSTFGVILITVIIGFCISLVLQFPLAIYSLVSGVSSLESFDFTSMLKSLSSPISLLYYGLTHFFGTITSLTILIGGLSFQYFNLVEMKEAKGLMGEIEGITNTETSAEEENETY